MGKISRGEMISPDEPAHYLNQRRQSQQRSEPYSQEKGKEGKGKDKQTGKGKDPHFSGRYDRDGNPVHIFDNVEEMRESGHDGVF